MIIAAVPLGVMAICIARALYTQIAVVINTYYTGKLFDLGYVRQVKDFSKYLVFSVIAVIPAFLLTYLNISDIVQLLLGGAIAAILYILFLYKDAYFTELIQIIKNALKR